MPPKDQKNALSRPVNWDVTMHGKIPPQARDLEMAILGACLLERDAYKKISEFLTPDMFYLDEHTIIYQSIADLVKRSIIPDLLLVVEDLNGKGFLDKVGGPFYVTKLTNAVVSTANIIEHSQIVYQKWAAREAIRLAANIINIAYQSDVTLFDSLDQMGAAFHLLNRLKDSGKTKKLEQVIFEVIEDSDKPKIREGISGVPTGFPSLDACTAGWQDTDLIILAARPSMGKSALAAQFAYRPAFRYKIPTAMFSLEMSSKQITNRVIASENEIYASNLLKRDFNPYDIRKMNEFYELSLDTPMYLNDAADLTLQGLCIEIRRLVEYLGVKLVVIDYLQLISLSREQQKYGNSNRDQDIGIITKTLKQLAKDLVIPIILLSQLTRETENTQNKRPMLKNLRESGNIEQDADVVMFLHREFYYLQRENPNAFFEPAIMKGADVSFAKHRNGGLDLIDLIWEAKYVQFLDAKEVGLSYGDSPF